MDDEYKCVICGARRFGWGNNARPVKDGLCCDECNMCVVIPARMRKWKEGRQE